jgi:hypothetical protein
MDGWLVGWPVGEAESWMCRRMYGCVEEWMHQRKDRWMDDGMEGGEKC